ncbi:MAG: S-layer homology domain-containing protein [Clostridia bacterium]|nr:S-layer homology domain-containing protein [Clostridia bacterium]
MKKFLSMLLAIIVATGAFSITFVSASADEPPLLISPAPAAQRVFTDVEPGTALETALVKLKNAGIINGYEDGSFQPAGGLSRAEFCKMINILFGYTELATTGFPDVPADAWYHDHVLIAKKQGYIQGFEDGTFRGNEKITREQVCVIIDRINNCYKLYDVVINDEVSDWSRESVIKVISNGLMPLEEGGTFRAKQIITRAEFSYVFVPFLDARAEIEADKEQTPGTGAGTGTGSTTKPAGSTTKPGSGAVVPGGGGAVKPGTGTTNPPAGGDKEDEGGTGTTNPPAGGDKDDEGGTGTTNPPAGGDKEDEGGTGTTNPPAGGDKDDEGGTGTTNPPAGGDKEDEGGTGTTNPPTGGDKEDEGGTGTTNPPAGGDDGNDDPTDPPAGGDDGNDYPTDPPAGGDDGNDYPTDPPAGDDDDEVDMTEDDIVIDEIKKLLADLDARKRFTHPKEFGPFFNKLKNVLRDVIADSETILITPEYVNEEYYDVMQEFKEDYKNLCDICVGEFNAIVNDCATKYKTVLVEYFYDIIPEEAFEMID